MIVVLKHGVVKDERYYGTCNKCAGQLCFEKADALSTMPGNQRDGPFATVRCPTPDCNSDVFGYQKKN